MLNCLSLIFTRVSEIFTLQLYFVSDIDETKFHIIALLVIFSGYWLPWYNWNIVESGVKHHNPIPFHHIHLYNLKPNTCLNWTNSSVPKGFSLDRFYCISKHKKNYSDITMPSWWSSLVLSAERNLEIHHAKR
jgi:hypothetical protein